MNKNVTTLSEKRNELTRGLIIAAALDLLKTAAPGEVTVRAVAQRADMSERTVFRYAASRDALLDDVAAHLVGALELPPPPATLEALLALPAALYTAFETHADLTRAALHPDMVGRIRSLQASTRWNAVQAILGEAAPGAAPADMRIAVANICYHLTASSWHYYRSAFGFGLDECIACAAAAVRQATGELTRRAS